MEFWHRLVVSASAVFGVVILIMGFVVDYSPFKERLPEKLRNHPRFKWIAICPIALAFYLHLIWSQPASHPLPLPLPLPLADIKPIAEPHRGEKKSKEPDSEASNNESKELVPNQQAEAMAKEFLTVFAAINGKRLAAYEEEFYSDYLRATMPAKIASICGDEECDQFEELLKRLKSKSGNLQLHYRGIEPFVTRKRYINPQTPSAGPVIALTQSEPDNKSAPTKDGSQTVVAAKPVIDEKGVIDSTFVPQIAPKADPKNQKPSSENLTPKASKNTTLTEYLARTGWVQCRKCGMIHYMDFEAFAQFNSMNCANRKCRFQMHFDGFHEQIAAEAARLRREGK